MYNTNTVDPSLKIEFSENEVVNLHQPHNDALVIALTIANIKVHRILIDGGSSANILSLTAFNAKNLGEDKFKGNLTPLVGFGGERVMLEGSI